MSDRLARIGRGLYRLGMGAAVLAAFAVAAPFMVVGLGIYGVYAIGREILDRQNRFRL